jgi:uncharacterized membrane protein YqjE
MASTDTGMRVVPATERSTAELAGDLARQMTTLLHHEMELAKVEMTEKSKRAGLGAGMLGAAGLLAWFGFACLTACAIVALDLALPLWLAALIIGAVYLALGGIAALVGRAQVREAAPPIPEQAVESSKEDVQWLKTQAESARR